MADSAGRSRACEPWAQAPTARRPSGQLRGPPSHAPCGQVTPFNPRKTCLVQGQPWAHPRSRCTQRPRSCPPGPFAPSDHLPAGSSGAMPGEEASLAVPPPVLTLGVNRNIKSLLGGQETGNNQNTVSCPRPGHRAACHRPSTAARGFPSLASTQAAALGLVRPQWPTPQGTILRLPEKLAAMLRPQAAPPPRCHHWAGHPPALRPQGSGVGRRRAPGGSRGAWELVLAVLSLLLGQELARGWLHPEDRDL